MHRFSIPVLLAFFISAFPTSNVTAIQPAIRVTPDAGTINGQVTVEGKNFPAGIKVLVFLSTPHVDDTLDYANTPYGAAIADSRGKFTASFIMPGTWSNGDPIIHHKLMIIAADTERRAKASAVFDYNPAPLESLGWSRYTNHKYGFRLMVPPGWAVYDSDNIINIQIEDNPQAGAVKILLAPVTIFGGDTIDGRDAASSSLGYYAKNALHYEVRGADGFALKQVRRITTTFGQSAYETYWQLSATAVESYANTQSATGNKPTSSLFTAVYFSLNVERSGSFYRALEISTSSAQMPSPNLFKAIVHSLTISKPLSERDYAALRQAASVHVKPAEDFYLEVQAIQNDYVRFIVIPTGMTKTQTYTGFARKDRNDWTVFSVGTTFDMRFYEQHRIPLRLRK